MESEHDLKIWVAEVKVQNEPEGRRWLCFMKNFELIGQSGA